MTYINSRPTPVSTRPSFADARTQTVSPGRAFRDLADAAVRAAAFVFVYGTLKRRFGNHRLLEQSGAFFVCDAVMATGKFFLTGEGIPYLIRDNDAPTHATPRVTGEVYAVTAEGLAWLDRLEGTPHHYERLAVDVCPAHPTDLMPGVDAPTISTLLSRVVFAYSPPPGEMNDLRRDAFRGYREKYATFGEGRHVPVLPCTISELSAAGSVRRNGGPLVTAEATPRAQEAARRLDAVAQFENDLDDEEDFDFSDDDETDDEGDMNEALKDMREADYTPRPGLADIEAAFLAGSK